jgi:hypothetical protein
MSREVESLTGGTKWITPKGNTTLLDKVLTRCALDLGSLPPVDFNDVPYDGTNQHADDVPQTITRESSQECPAVPQPGTLSHFDQDTIDALMEVARWWRAKGCVEPPVDEDTAPKFKPLGTPKTYSVRLPEALVDAVNTELNKQGAKHGGTFSRLVMWLLWRYVGSPSEYIESRE